MDVEFACYLFQDMWLYLSEKEKFNDFGNESALIWHETNIPYAVWGPTSSRSLSLKYTPSEVLLLDICRLTLKSTIFKMEVSSVYPFV